MQDTAKDARKPFQTSRHTVGTLDKEFGYKVFAQLAIFLQPISTNGATPNIDDGLSVRVTKDSLMHNVCGTYSGVLAEVLDVVCTAVSRTELAQVRTHNSGHGH